MTKRGFNLIEVMVVIAIISFTVGMAVPHYKNYIIRARVSTAFEVMKKYAQMGQEYYEAHGEFGDAAEIGLVTATQPYNVANPSTINEFTSVQIVDVDATSKCYNNIRFTFSGSALGAPQDFDIQMLLRQHGGMYVITCGIPSDQTSGSYSAVLKYFPESCSDQNVSTC